MSQWTQIAGVVRIDGFPSVGGYTDADMQTELKQNLGTIVKYNSPHELWHLSPEQRTPLGSEGGTGYSYVQTADAGSNSMNRGVLVIEGSLRDFGDEKDIQEVIDWLNRAFEFPKGEDSRRTYFARQGIVELIVEGGKDEGITLLEFSSGDKFVKKI